MLAPLFFQEAAKLSAQVLPKSVLTTIMPTFLIDWPVVLKYSFARPTQGPIVRSVLLMKRTTSLLPSLVNLGVWDVAIRIKPSCWLKPIIGNAARLEGVSTARTLCCDASSLPQFTALSGLNSSSQNTGETVYALPPTFTPPALLTSSTAVLMPFWNAVP